MSKQHVKKGDEVVVIAGADKGKRGKIISVNAKQSRVFVEGVHIIKKHQKKSQDQPNGAIVEREGTVHMSNVMSAKKFDARAQKRGAQATA